MKTICAEKNELCLKAALHIKELLAKKPDSVLALSFGKASACLYAQLCRMCQAGELSFRQARLFSVSEFNPPDADFCYRSFLEKTFIDNIDVLSQNVHYPSPDDCAGYDAMIAEAGGLDIAILDIGVNGRIGFNEPATLFDTRTHVQKLTNPTRQELANFIDDAQKVPPSAVTMGIKTLVESKEAMLLAFGSHMAEPVFNTVYGKTISYIPASFFQIPMNVALYVDTEAGAKL